MNLIVGHGNKIETSRLAVLLLLDRYLVEFLLVVLLVLSAFCLIDLLASRLDKL